MIKLTDFTEQQLALMLGLLQDKSHEFKGKLLIIKQYGLASIQQDTISQVERNLENLETILVQVGTALTMVRGEEKVIQN